MAEFKKPYSLVPQIHLRQQNYNFVLHTVLLMRTLMYFVNFLGTFQFCFRSSSLCTTYNMPFTSDMQSFSTLILSLAVESESTDELMLISTESHTLAASAGQRRESGRVLRIQEKWGRFFFFCFCFCFFSLSLFPITRVWACTCTHQQLEFN